MARKQKKLTDEELLSILRSAVSSGEKYNNTKLSKERERVQDYYEGKKPLPVHGGNSKYVSTDVYDSVESAKAILVETFSSGRDIVQFSPTGPEDIEAAKVCTDYTKYVIFNQNDADHVFGSVIHDGLIARAGVARVYWDECVEEIEEEFEGYDEDKFNVLLSDPEVELLEAEIDDSGAISGTIIRKMDNSRVKIEPVPPEQFIVNPAIKRFTRTTDCSFIEEKTRSELLAEGYKSSQIDKIGPVEGELGLDSEKLARYDPVGGDNLSLRDESTQASSEKFLVRESYTWLDLDGSGRNRFWKVIWSGGVVLDKEQVDRHPFLTYAPVPIPHRFHGNNYADRVVPTQNAKTVLTRGVLDHTVVTNNPRYGVVKGALTNPRELIDNRIGGLVNVTRPDGIFPLPQASLNPYVFQTLQMLDEDKEDSTGVSRLSQGLNKDAVSNQNSDAMVERLMSASMQRQKIMARQFANQFLKPLYLEVYQLVIENEKNERVFEVAGAYIPVTPSKWRKRIDVSVDLRLGYREDERQVEELLAFHNMLTSDEGSSRLYDEAKRFNLFKKVLGIKGYKNPIEFVNDPTKMKPPEPDPMAMAELEKVKAETQSIAVNAQVQQMKAQLEGQLEQTRLDMEQRFKTIEFMLQTREADRKDAETQNRIETAIAELALAQETAADEGAEKKTSAIISPNS
ncbi:hypothetical protein BSL82_03380 [Tardibacter chloracetimidivorans]|uniref:Portal protein n=1 Tax=Tardibacter chloracetimidivorans TaxID=1921510 RepID=A0A1L3ZS56_9SPHN|nr:cell envelope integrity protein TolA [Tardibacter chloracetimidivorans]API58459.1 hypothetical protein BSL82_03380 [Tardibacter chloracetimidivorans]